VNQNSSNWKAFYQDALLELDPEKMPQKIDAAQNAIADRVEDGLHGRCPIGPAERQRIADARHYLSYLKEHPAA
jgi:hypothetical protein